MPRRRLAAGLIALGLLVLPCCAPAPAPEEHGDPPRIIGRLPWHDAGVLLRGDPHIHRLTRDGNETRIPQRALDVGLDFIAMTDHAQNNFRRDPAAKLDAMRKRFPDLVFIDGIEWNVPAGDHATVLAAPAPDASEVLERFTERFDRKVRPDLAALEPAETGEDDDSHVTWGRIEDAIEAIEWLAGASRRSKVHSTVYLNHVSRNSDFTPAQIERLLRAGMSGVEAAPGHQRRPHPGFPTTLDRYDPIVAELAGTLDTWLGRGLRVGLSAGSDFHNQRTAYLPGEFSVTLVHAPERSARGVVEGLAAGATSTVQGGIVHAVQTWTGCDGFDDRALMGEGLEVRAGTPVVYTLILTLPERDSLGRANRIDEVEIISDYPGRPSVVHRFEALRPGQATLPFSVPAEATSAPGRFFLRARGRRLIGGPEHDAANADLLFYTTATTVTIVP